MRQHLDTERLAQERARDGACGDAGGGFAGAGAFQHRPGVVEAVLQHPGVVGVAGPGPGQRRIAGDVFEVSARVDGVGGHHGFPLGPFGVADLDGDRTAEGDAVAHPGQHGDLVGFELHPRAAAIAEPAAGQLTGDVLGGDVDTGDHAFDHGHQRAAVGFTSCGPSQHASHLPMSGFPDRFRCAFRRRAERRLLHDKSPERRPRRWRRTSTGRAARSTAARRMTATIAHTAVSSGAAERGQHPDVDAERAGQRAHTDRELDVAGAHRRRCQQVHDEIQQPPARRRRRARAGHVRRQRRRRGPRRRRAASRRSAAAATGCRRRSAPSATPDAPHRPPRPHGPRLTSAQGGPHRFFGRGQPGELLDLCERLVQQHLQAADHPAAGRLDRRGQRRRPRVVDRVEQQRRRAPTPARTAPPRRPGSC